VGDFRWSAAQMLRVPAIARLAAAAAAAAAPSSEEHHPQSGGAQAPPPEARSNHMLAWGV
jgi:hypothetical protein